MDMPFDERLYAEMAGFVPEKTAGNILLVGMNPVWEARFRQDFAEGVFQTVPWDMALNEAWQRCFSLIVLAPGIEELFEPECLLESLQPSLQPCGGVVVPFCNPWHWSVFRSWLKGELRYGTNPLLKGQGRLFSFPEIVRLAKLAHYREFAVRQVLEEGAADMLAVLQGCGFGNGQKEIETSWWIVRLAVFPMRTARLRERYTDEVRHRLARLLHRLENGVEEAASVEALRRLIAENDIDGGYLERFVENIAAEAEKLLAALRKEGLLR